MRHLMRRLTVAGFPEAASAAAASSPVFLQVERWPANGDTRPPSLALDCRLPDQLRRVPGGTGSYRVVQCDGVGE